MSDKPETIDDILAEMRRCADYLPSRQKYVPRLSILAWRNLADRIEAAVVRERNAHINDIHDALYAATGTPGNAAAMREALLRVKEARGRDLEYVTLADIDSEVDAALAAPARNCDVGTAVEQGDRFARFCACYICCSQCPIKARWNFDNGHKPSCGVIWGQMPYEKGGAE